jgi:hypothetical protein
MRANTNLLFYRLQFPHEYTRSHTYIHTHGLAVFTQRDDPIFVHSSDDDTAWRCNSDDEFGHYAGEEGGASAAEVGEWLYRSVYREYDAAHPQAPLLRQEPDSVQAFSPPILRPAGQAARLGAVISGSSPDDSSGIFMFPFQRTEVWHWAILIIDFINKRFAVYGDTLARIASYSDVQRRLLQLNVSCATLQDEFTEDNTSDLPIQLGGDDCGARVCVFARWWLTDRCMPGYCAAVAGDVFELEVAILMNFWQERRLRRRIRRTYVTTD